jgi:hypothetical protein
MHDSARHSATVHDPIAATMFAPIGTPRAQRAFALVFCVLLALPLATRIAGWDNQVQRLEQHEPARLPPLPRNGAALHAWPQAFDRWLLDGAGLRNAMVFADSAIRVYVLRQSTNDAVVLGREGWLFHAGDRTFEQLRGEDRFTPAQLDRWIDRMEQRRAWLAERGIALLLVVVPNKERVYAELLPATHAQVGPVSRMTQLTERVRERGSPLQVLDLTDILVAAKREMQVFAKNDTHWSGAGGFRAYQAIMRRLQPMLPTLQPLEVGAMKPVAFTYPAYQLDLLRMLGLGWHGPSETLDYPLFREEPPWSMQRKDVVVDGVPQVRLSSSRSGAPSSLWLRDSFSDTIAVYLNATFGSAVLMPHRGMRFDAHLIEAERPDVVVYEVVERFLVDELPPDSLPPAEPQVADIR